LNIQWDVDEATVIKAKMGAFGKSVLTVRGTEIPNELKLRKKMRFWFDLPDGRPAEILVSPRFGGAADIELRVDGQLMAPTEKQPVKCDACGAVVRPNDRFCEACGHPTPPAENYLHRKRLKEASGAIWMMAVLFAIFGVVFFFITRSQGAPILGKLAGMDANARVTATATGVTYTVSALRDKISWAPWNVLFLNLFLAVVMVGLAFWGRRAPLAAILVATATYAVVIVANAIVDPATIAQGVVVKVIVILVLFRGIRGALALRPANA
jgi:hypothetical protein